MSHTCLCCCFCISFVFIFFFFQAEDGIRDLTVTGVQTCALPISAGTLRIRAEWHSYDRSGSTQTAATQPTPGLSDKTWATRDSPIDRRISRSFSREVEGEAPDETTATPVGRAPLGVCVSARAAAA